MKHIAPTLIAALFISSMAAAADVPVGGEAGRVMCGAYGAAKCRSSGGQVDYNGCP